MLRHWIDRAAARDPDTAFIVAVDDGRTLTYGDLRDVTGRIAAFLRGQGIGANDRVALLSNNSIEHLATYFGVMAAGATVCTVHVEMNRNQLDSILPALKARLALCEAGLGLDDMLDAAATPVLPLGSWDDRRGGRRRGDLFHLRHQRTAEGRGVELPRASCQRRSDRGRL